MNSELGTSAASNQPNSVVTTEQANTANTYTDGNNIENSHIDARAIDFGLDNSRNITVVSGTSEHADHLVVLYYNARSIVSKFDELNVTVRLKQPNIVCIVETWLSSDILDKEIHLPGYQLLRLDRNRHGGGILLYVHEMMSYKLLVRGGPFNLEFISISVTSPIINPRRMRRRVTVLGLSVCPSVLPSFRPHTNLTM